MKKSVLFILISICAIAYSYSQELLNIDVAKSQLKWSCDYAFYFGGHYGYVKFKEGNFLKTDGRITGGTFVIDLNTLTSTDIENPESNKGLVDHIKNEDFFDVITYPTATLVITKTSYHDTTHLKIWADLTIKGITKPINFQAEVDYEELSLITKFKIDRTLWNINYKSKGLMSGMKNEAISDAIGFQVNLRL